MIVCKKPIGTVAYMGGVPSVLEPFLWSWGQMIQYNNEFLCKPGEYVHTLKAISSFHSSARNALVKQFLGDWIFQTDTDHSFEPDIVARMVALMYKADIDVLTAIYRYRVHPFLPTIYKWREDVHAYCPVAVLEDAPLIEIDCAGAGCLLVRRRVFERIHRELKEEPFTVENPFSEDFSFFNRLRRLGIQAYCAPHIHSHHLLIRPVVEGDFDARGLPLVDAGLKSKELNV